MSVTGWNDTREEGCVKGLGLELGAGRGKNVANTRKRIDKIDLSMATCRLHSLVRGDGTCSNLLFRKVMNVRSSGKTCYKSNTRIEEDSKIIPRFEDSKSSVHFASSWKSFFHPVISGQRFRSPSSAHVISGRSFQRTSS